VKRLAIVMAVIIVLIVTGGLTAQIASQGGSLSIPGLIRQTANPDASAMDMTAWKAEQLFLAVGFILFNLVGMAVTIMAVIWFFNWQIKKTRAQGRQTATESAPAQTE
jgi:predicted membrane protein